MFCRLAITLLAIGCVVSSAQTSLDAKRRELESLRKSIQITRDKLDALHRKESTAKRSLSTYQKQRHNISKHIQRLQVELEALQDSAHVLSGNIRATQQALRDAEDSYNRTATNLAAWNVRNRGNVTMQSSVHPVFRSLTASLATYRATMITLKDSLEKQQGLLESYVETQETVLQARAREQARLAQNISKSSRQLAAIRSNKQQLTKELQQKQASVHKLRALINRLVAAEQQKAEARRKAERQKQEAARRKAAASGKSAPSLTPSPSETVTGFAAKSLPWPTSSKRILHGYGSYVNPQTKTTLDNPGIDIATPVGSTVSCVAPGQVSSVTWLPGFGSLVIVDHGNGVRTVYANLATVQVGKGATVAAGTVVGTSGENIDGALVHFELWNGRNRQNPLHYLK